MIQKLRKQNMPRGAYWGLLAGIVAARLLVVYAQRVFLMIGGAALDDMLMVNAAQSMAAGNWLGDYGAFAIAKNMGFSVWVWLLHTLHVPLLLGNALLWLAACAFAVRAVRPLFPGNLLRALLFGFFAFQPVSWAEYTMRAYRDGIFPAFCLFLFAGAVGLGLRLSQNRLRGSVLMAVGAGVGLTGGWLLREDGVVLLLFAAAALAFVGGFALFHPAARKRLGKLVCAVLPAVLLGGGILAFCGANNSAYGVFLVNDLTGGSFPGAYGAMSGVSEGESGYTELTPVTRQALERMFEEVPALALLEDDLLSGPAFNGFADGESGEFGGSFYYALRLAADYAGLTPDAPTAQKYWARVQAEIEAAVEEGRLQSVGGSRSVVPRYDSSLLVPTALETVYGGLHLMLFEDMHPQPQFSLGDDEDEIQRVAGFLHERVQTGYAESTQEPYFNWLQRGVFAVLEALRLVYSLLVWPLLAVAALRCAQTLAAGVGDVFKKRGIRPQLLSAVLALGLFLSFLARLVVAAYMEVASFRVGTYTMYLASAMPALLLFMVVGCALQRPEQRAGAARLRWTAPRQGKRDVRPWAMLAIGAGLVCLKLLLAAAQDVYLDIAESGLDDAYMISTAMSITRGEWLGAYGPLTLAKHSFFALWLAFLHLVRIPVLLGGQLLWAAAAAAAAWAFAPLLKRLWLCLCLFGALLFLPSSTANAPPYGYITRVYRDNIFPALCLLCIAGIVGYALRYQKPLRKSVGWLVLCGLALAAAWLTREDGWWLLPFLVAAVAVVCFTVLRADAGQKLLKCAALLLPFALLVGGIAAWAGMNYSHYGRFIVSDFSSGEFADAYGALTRIEHEDWDPQVAVPREVREQLYEHVPAFKELEPWLESEEFYNAYASGGEYSSGSFYWALRDAAAAAGHYESAETARQYFATLARQVNEKCEDGTLAAGMRRSSVNPPIRAEYIGPVSAEALRSLWYVMTFQGCEAESLLSRDHYDDNGPVEAYIGQRALTTALEGGDEPYFAAIKLKAYRALEIIRQVYTVAVPLGFLAALCSCIVAGVRLVRRARKKRRNVWETLVFWLMLGLLLCLLLRCFMIAFVTVSSFQVGTYVMYLASVHPLVLVFAFVGSVLLVRRIRTAARPRAAVVHRLGGV